MTMADIQVKATVTSSTPTSGAVQGAIGIAGIIQRPLKDFSVIKVTSFEEAKRKLGAYMAESTVMYGLEKIFKKLGKAEVYISPVTHRTLSTDATTEVGKSAKITLKDTGSTNSIVDVETNFVGLEANKYAIKVSNVNVTNKTYDIEILFNGVVVGQKVIGVTNTTYLSRVAHPDLSFTMLLNTDATLPEAKTFTLTGGVDAHTGVAPSDYDLAISKLGKKPLDFILVDSTLVTNGQTAVALGKQINALAFLNTPNGTTDAGALTHRANFSDQSGMLFHPHQYEVDPLGTKNRPNRAIPIAYEAVANYILAHKNVGRRQVGAGIIFGGLTGLGLTSQPDADALSENGINYAVSFENEGTFLWEAMTLSNDPNWQDANRVLLFNYILKTLRPSLRPDLFNVVDENVFKSVTTRLSIPLRNLLKAKELFSADGSEKSAFFVQCDETNNTLDSQLSKKLFVKVGYKDKKMIKWIVLDIEVA